MSERSYYCISDDNCKFPSMTSEQILAAIAQATGNTPQNVDNAFVTKLKEMNSGGDLTVWIGTSAEYAAIVAADALVPNRLYITTDDTFESGVTEAIEELRSQIAALSAFLISGDWVQIKRYKQVTSHEKTVIGSYKLVGNMYTVSLQYNPAEFDSYSSGHESCPLPISLDIPTEAITVPVLVSKGDGSTVSYSMGEAVINKNSVDIYGIAGSGATQLQGIGVVFSLPKAEDETVVG